jgi:hypothetical protein
MVLWINNLSENEYLMDEMVSEATEAHNITKLLNAVHLQSMAVQMLKEARTPQGKTEAYSQIKSYGETFGNLTRLLLSRPMEDVEQKTWEEISTHLKMSENSLEQAEILIANDQKEKAYQSIIDESEHYQHNLMGSVSSLLSNELLDASQKEISDTYTEVQKKNEATYMLLFFFGWISLFLSLFIISIIKRSVTSETATIEQGERLRDLYEATSLSGMSLDEKIRNEHINIFEYHCS